MQLKFLNHLISWLVILIFTTCGIKKETKTSKSNNIIVTDIDGNKYRAVTIGTQVWMAENLKTTRYNDGSSITFVQDSTNWGDSLKGAYCYYGNSIDNQDHYGNLYNWYAVNDPHKLAPKGWHIPTSNEWAILLNHLGGESKASPKLRQQGSKFWAYPNYKANNESGFNALPGGFRFSQGNFYNWEYSELGTSGSFWTSTPYEKRKYYANFIKIYLGNTSIGVMGGDKNNGMSVRCIKD